MPVFLGATEVGGLLFFGVPLFTVLVAAGLRLTVIDCAPILAGYWGNDTGIAGVLALSFDAMPHVEQDGWSTPCSAGKSHNART